MLIDRNYINERRSTLIKEKQTEINENRNTTDRLYLIKLRFPLWLRKIIFHPFNPAYSIYLQSKAMKSKKGVCSLDVLHNFALDFQTYHHENNISFDTSLYYPKQDQADLKAYIDNRIKSLLPGYATLKLTDSDMEIFSKKQEVEQAISKTKDGYRLTLDSASYYLPTKSFQEHTYIHDYGLKYLPLGVANYIAGKDFLDVGSFLGDTAILLLKKYKPTHIYAFEPVSANLANLHKTIKGNNAENQITVIQKGVGQTEGAFDIFIDPTNLSACSMNEKVVDNNFAKEQIAITTIDKECVDKKIGLIKMDVEGAEYGAIKGALQTIKRDKPVLLISLYHTAKDFFEIPPMLKAAVPEYNFRFINIEIVNPLSEKILVAYPKHLSN